MEWSGTHPVPALLPEGEGHSLCDTLACFTGAQLRNSVARHSALARSGRAWLGTQPASWTRIHGRFRRPANRSRAGRPEYVAKLDLWRRILEKQRAVNAPLPPCEAGVMGIKYYRFGGVPAAGSMVMATA